MSIALHFRNSRIVSAALMAGAFGPDAYSFHDGSWGEWGESFDDPAQHLVVTVPGQDAERAASMAARLGVAVEFTLAADYTCHVLVPGTEGRRTWTDDKREGFPDPDEALDSLADALWAADTNGPDDYTPEDRSNYRHMAAVAVLHGKGIA